MPKTSHKYQVYMKDNSTTHTHLRAEGQVVTVSGLRAELDVVGRGGLRAWESARTR